MWGFNPQEERVKLFKSISPQRRHSLTNPSQHWCAHEESVNQWAPRLILIRHDCRQKALNIIRCDVSHSGGTEDGCEHPVKRGESPSTRSRLEESSVPTLPFPLQLSTSPEWNRLITRHHCGRQPSGNQLGSRGCMTCHPFSKA